MFCTTITLCLVFVPKMVELRKDQGGSIDKRIRATLRPMSKTRRDSSVSEIETKIKDLKELNTKYRKTLLDRDNELQVSLVHLIICHISYVATFADAYKTVGYRRH